MNYNIIYKIDKFDMEKCQNKIFYINTVWDVFLYIKYPAGHI